MVLLVPETPAPSSQILVTHLWLSTNPCTLGQDTFIPGDLLGPPLCQPHRTPWAELPVKGLLQPWGCLCFGEGQAAHRGTWGACRVHGTTHEWVPQVTAKHQPTSCYSQARALLSAPVMCSAFMQAGAL